ncbi:hypothetical protein DJ90_6230 [Paenibacillus macerans]|uniref:Uncharacterized protein n=1 Tax=Paenibacillus macerans TaxID=44252 RepID=A0A090XUC1_PAEMA|nr:hypothetical protein DJ90_6230 [Paenibacillus macerans]
MMRKSFLTGLLCALVSILFMILKCEASSYFFECYRDREAARYIVQRCLRVAEIDEFSRNAVRRPKRAGGLLFRHCGVKKV